MNHNKPFCAQQGNSTGCSDHLNRLVFSPLCMKSMQIRLGLHVLPSIVLVLHDMLPAAADARAAAVSEKEAQTGSSHQQPSKAPEPPSHQQSSPPFPDSPPPCQPTNTTATVELDVKLRSLVLNLSTDSVCVGIRMMERFQQYQQHAHLWQGRPQVHLRSCPMMSVHNCVAAYRQLLFSQQLACSCSVSCHQCGVLHVRVEAYEQ